LNILALLKNLPQTGGNDAQKIATGHPGTMFAPLQGVFHHEKKAVTAVF
jgi:hypothetical protein